MATNNRAVVSTVLAQLSWNEAHAIPIANEENQKLIHQVEQIQRQLHHRTVELDVEKSKVQQLREHMKNVQQETTYTASLCDLRKNEVDSVNHERILIEREQGRMSQELSRLDDRREEMRGKKQRLENIGFRKRLELDTVSSRKGTDKRALDKWIEAIELRNEDMMIMKKYIREDDSKIKDLDLEMQQLTTKLRERKSTLGTLYTKTQTCQVALDGLSRETRIAYNERDSMIAQWENMINRMRQRDEELRHMADRLNTMRMHVSEQETNVGELEDFLAAQRDSATDVQRHSDEVVSSIGKARQELNDSQQRSQSFHSELEALKRTVDKLAGDLENIRAKVSQLRKEKVRRTNQFETIEQQITELHDRLKYVTESKLDAEQLANEADASLSTAETNRERAVRYLGRLRDERFKSVQSIEKNATEIKLAEQQLQGAIASLRICNAKLANLDHQLLRHQEIIYKEDFSLQQFERRISRMKGEHADEESKEALEEKVRELTADLDERTKVAKMLTSQLANLRRDSHRKKREVQALSEKTSASETQMQTNELEVDIALRESTKMTSTLEKLMVEKNMMRLQVGRLFKDYENRSNRVYNLETMKEDLSLAVKERMQQIELHQSMLNGQTRIGAEENSQLKVEHQSRKARIDKLIKRYEILTSLMAPPDGEEERSQTYYIIKAAQDKELLQRKGDALDKETQQAEQELIALENTLAVMNGCNNVYGMSYAKLPEDAEELRLTKDLKEQIRVLTIKSRYDGNRLNELKENEETQLRLKYELDTDLELYTQQYSELAREEGKKSRELETLKERLNRAVKKVEKTKTAVASGTAISEEQREQFRKDIQVRMSKESVDQLTSEFITRIRPDEQMLDQAYVMLSSSGLPFNRLSERRVSRITPSSPESTASSVRGGTYRTTPTGSSRPSPAGSVDSSREHTARGQSPSNASVSSQQNYQLPKPVSSVDLSQQAVLPGEARSQSGSQSQRSMASDKSRGKSGSSTAWK